jgi:hypothetical protein
MTKQTLVLWIVPHRLLLMTTCHNPDDNAHFQDENLKFHIIYDKP